MFHFTGKFKRIFVLGGIDTTQEFFIKNVLSEKQQHAFFRDISYLGGSNIFFARGIDYFYSRARLRAKAYHLSPF